MPVKIEEISLSEQKIVRSPREMVYDSQYPPEFFDFIITAPFITYDSRYSTFER
jgi:hypothetical protein